jgi:hypothetical protein
MHYLNIKRNQHQRLIESQRSMFNEELKTLRNNERALVPDYTRFHDTETFKVHYICFTIYTRRFDGELHHEWMDYFCEVPFQINIKTHSSWSVRSARGGGVSVTEMHDITIHFKLMQDFHN